MEKISKLIRKCADAGEQATSAERAREATSETRDKQAAKKKRAQQTHAEAAARETRARAHAADDQESKSYATLARVHDARQMGMQRRSGQTRRGQGSLPATLSNDVLDP